MLSANSVLENVKNLGWQKTLILISVFSCILAFLLFSPSFYASIDEHGYLKNTVLLSNGTLNEPDAEFAARSTFNGQDYVLNRFIGKSVFLIPFMFLGIFGIMLSGLIIHLINFFILIKIFEKLNVRKIFALLYILFPTFIWMSRTLYAGLLVLTFFLIVFYFLISDKKRDWALAGFFSGLAVLVRNDAAYGIIALVIIFLFFKRKKFVPFILGGIPVALFLFGFNTLMFGGPITTGSGNALNLLTNFSFSALPNFLIYFVILLFYLPLLIVSPLFENRTKLKLEFLAFSFAYLIFNLTFTNFFVFDFSFESLFTSRLRYLVPLIGVLLIPYGVFLDSLVEKNLLLKKHFSKIAVFVVLVMLFGVFLVSSNHSDFLNGKRKAVFDHIYSNTSDGSLVVGSSDDAMFFVKDFFPLRKYFSIDPGADLGGNPENIDVLEEIKNNDSFLLIVDYSHLFGKDALRNKVVQGERKKIFDFYELNKDSFDLVVQDSEITLYLYKYNGGKLVKV